jgi:hypothetical protein
MVSVSVAIKCSSCRQGSVGNAEALDPSVLELAIGTLIAVATDGVTANLRWDALPLADPKLRAVVSQAAGADLIRTAAQAVAALLSVRAALDELGATAKGAPTPARALRQATLVGLTS